MPLVGISQVQEPLLVAVLSLSLCIQGLLSFLIGAYLPPLVAPALETINFPMQNGTMFYATQINQGQSKYGWGTIPKS